MKTGKVARLNTLITDYLRSVESTCGEWLARKYTVCLHECNMILTALKVGVHSATVEGECDPYECC